MIASLVGALGGATACGGGSSSNDMTASSDATTPPTDGGTTRDDGDVDLAGDMKLDTSPITAAADSWTWVDFPTSKCASGTATGIAVNPHAKATSTVIWFEGGGECTTGDTCWGSVPTASNLTGYDATTFAAEMPSMPALDRSVSGNPFAAMNFVYVPYCTGDLHSGTTMVNLTENGKTIPTYFYGAIDTDIFLARLVPTFTNQERLWIMGGSAGGFATYMSFPRVTKAFGVPADMIDDSGPPIVAMNSQTNTNAALFTIWATGAGLPADCTGCNSFLDVLDYDLAAQAKYATPGEFAFLSFEEDKTIAPDFGYNDMTQYPMLMTQFSTSLMAYPHTATFLVSNYEAHVVQNTPTLAPYYLPWMTLMVNRDPSWADIVHDGKN